MDFFLLPFDFSCVFSKIIVLLHKLQPICSSEPDMIIIHNNRPFHFKICIFSDQVAIINVLKCQQQQKENMW